MVLLCNKRIIFSGKTLDIKKKIPGFEFSCFFLSFFDDPMQSIFISSVDKAFNSQRLNLLKTVVLYWNRYYCIKLWVPFLPYFPWFANI